MNRFIATPFVTLVVALPLLQPAMAGPVAQSRTYVSGVGKDTNPCSATLPCLTLATALNLTLAGGEIFVLDSANYGPITIKKAVSITSDGASGGILVSSGTAITISGGPNDVVNLKGLNLDGGNAATTGVQFISGAALNIQKTSFRNFATNGLSFAPTGAASSLSLSDVTLTGNGKTGVFVSSLGSTALNAIMVRVSATRNGIGVLVAGGTAKITLTDAIASENTYGVAVSAASVMVRNSTISNNSIGIASDQSAVVQVGQSTITGNNSGWNSTNGAKIVSYGNNNVSSNINDGTASATLALQ